MMKEGLLEKIQSVGFWRVNIRPVTPLRKALSFQRCNEVVERASVSIRGWDFPHISRRNDASGGRGNMGDYAESWTDWEGFHEFWRMYRSGQFIFIGLLHEDTEEWGNGAPAGTFLNTVSAIYSIAEFVEFSRRMSDVNLFPSGISIDISLNNSAGRALSVGRGRMPFFEKKVNGAQRIQLKGDFSIDEITQRSRDISIDFDLELFDYFGWNPDRSQIAGDQDKFFRKEFSW